MSTGMQRRWLFRLAERVFDFNARRSDRHYNRPGPPRHAGGLFAIPRDAHWIEPACALVSGSGAPPELALDREAVVTRAAQRHGDRRVLLYRVYVALLSTVLVGFGVWALWMTLFGDSERTAIALFVGIPFMACFLAVCGYLALANIGQQVAIVHAVEDWARVLGGACHTRDVRPVAEWLTRFWPWYGPPHFLAGETAWAAGTRRDQPMLIVSERDDHSILAVALSALQRLRETGEHHGLEAPTPTICRLSIFLPRLQLQSSQHAGPTMRELTTWGYGVVPTPAGIYLYGKADERSLRPEHLSTVIDKVMTVTQQEEATARPHVTEG